MTTAEDTWIPLIKQIQGNTSSPKKRSECLDVVVLSSKRTVTMPSNISNDEKKFNTKSAKKKSTDNITLSDISRRLAMRKDLHNRLCLVSDIMCFLGVFGIILMVIANEITFSQINHNDTILSWFIKLAISFSTLVLIGFVCKYHLLDIYLYSVNNSIDDWRITVTNKKILLILFEILICAVHPTPRSFPHQLNASLETRHLNSSISTNYTLSYIAVDVALGLPMFGRLYLVCRFIMFHSHLMHDALSQSVGYLNKISIDFFFLMKTYLEHSPIRCLTIFCLIIFLIGSWCLRACDYLPNREHVSMLDSMWLFIVTFTTVGYGDLAPSTYCGRGIAALIGLIGVFSTALIIAVLAQKLLLNRWEKHVHNFVLNIELAKDRRILAANVVKGTIRVWYLRNKIKSGSSFRYLQAQRQLLQSVHMLQQTKQEQRKLVDSCIDQTDILTLQRNTSDKTREVSQQLKIMKVKMDRIERELAEMNIYMNNAIRDIQNTLNTLLDKITK
ncbi:unnamed protein product [Rotaria socialis]|uniref:Calmodulin-binding domain-containing protein n=1 Tax=Rotaria socialis TaxID=392032 RepID=A0A817RED4_9BILA|nr:unnamed protein product [Rotaria socialis]CAF3240514.1 unnamed protein product [Rotaria socialis]CAF3354880.1 unnamed protein product [Rotaria socialis]CAF3472141.1 unnamed protein product [Rotaria socialis]CAF4188636.1 unnamed protein product [Rotaria socialis]